MHTHSGGNECGWSFFMLRSRGNDSPLTTHSLHSPLLLIISRHSPLTHHSSLTTHSRHSPLTPHSPLVTHHSVVTHHSLVTRHSPCTQKCLSRGHSGWRTRSQMSAPANCRHSCCSCRAAAGWGSKVKGTQPDGGVIDREREGGKERKEERERRKKKSPLFCLTRRPLVPFVPCFLCCLSVPLSCLVLYSLIVSLSLVIYLPQ